MSFDRQMNSNQLAREARIGLTIVAVLFTLLVYVASKRLSGGFDQGPKHYVSEADKQEPLAPLVSDHSPPEKKENDLASNHHSNPEPNKRNLEFNHNNKPAELPPTDLLPNPNLADSDPPQQQLPKTPAPNVLPESDQFPPVVLESGINVFENKSTAPSIPSIPDQKQVVTQQAELKKKSQALLQKTNDLRSKFSKMKAPSRTNQTPVPSSLLVDHPKQE